MRRFLAWTALGLFLFQLLGCKGVIIEGKTVKESFSDPREVELVEAAMRGDGATLEKLAAAGVNVNASGLHGTTPLIWTALSHNKKGIKKLLQLGANPNQHFEKGYTIVWFAAGGDDPELLEILLRHGGDPNVWVGSNNALMQAVEQRQWENFDLLIKYKANLNSADEVRSTVATYAAALNYFDKVAMMLDLGYTYDLPYLARLVEVSQVDEQSDQYKWRKKVLKMLESRGVKFPLAPPKPVIPLPMNPNTIEKLEKLEKEGKLAAGTKGREMLDQEREWDKIREHQNHSKNNSMQE